jgi:transcription initiation factor TFIIB
MSRYSTSVRCESHPDEPLVEDYRAGDLICSICGLVVGDRVIDVGSEWRTFANDNKETKDMCRVGATENPLMQGDLSTTIGMATGNAGFGDDGRPIYRNRNSESTQDRTIRVANREINEMAERLTVDRSIADKAQFIFHKVYTEKLIKGRSNDAIIAACMYIACRQQSVPRTFKEICRVSKSSKRDIGRCFKTILKSFQLSDNNQVKSASIPTITSGDFFARFCSRLALPLPVQRLANQIAEKANNLNLVAGRSPISLAAAAIYMSVLLHGLNKTPKEIADVSGVAENTIKQTYKVMQPRTNELIPTDFRSTLSAQTTA